ncbi:MAG: hypothetical protein EA357_00385 [Micavibrio sp.]|jgi:hypothetical protein|nr:MAG: hypothetical protein EA357_00385 [Micavibrio sp.]
MSDDENAFRYDRMVEDALRGVVRAALQETSETGLVNDHHFYITFQTKHKGVEIPDYLRERYPNEMTIVLQHQFYDLEIFKDRFSVMLSFNNIPERLVVPLQSITIFADPSVNFALQFQPLNQTDGDVEGEGAQDDALKLNGQEGEKTGQVISLDRFRSQKENDD